MGSTVGYARAQPVQARAWAKHRGESLAPRVVSLLTQARGDLGHRGRVEDYGQKGRDEADLQVIAGNDKVKA